ncbi:MAG: argininosuccinate lyase [Eubacteriales bacterium]
MKLWGGRFSKEESLSANEFNASIEFDQKLFAQDIEGSIAHAKMLGCQNIISKEESTTIINALQDILEDIYAGKIEFDIANEDIHMNIEAILTNRIGDVGKKLHTARSRNDQVALDLRLYVKEEIISIQLLLKSLLSCLLELSKEHQETVMPGYTHLQRAQPITFAFHLMAYFQMFKRDLERFEDSLKRTDVMPLGSCALAGTSYNTDRQLLASELGFNSVSENAMDSVSDRDFALEFLSASSITMMHLSRFCEELVIWSTSEFAFIEIDDAYSTGSSIMPQKKNPDMAELIRGKTGRVYGSLVTLLTIMKGLPLAYNKDMQEDKPPIFDTADTLKASLGIFIEMISTIKVKTENMSNAAKSGFLNATDAADYLVSKGMAFRDCHEVIGRMVLYCIEHNLAIEDLNMTQLKSFSDKFQQDIYDKISLNSCLASKISYGSTGFKSVSVMLENAELYLKTL